MEKKLKEIFYSIFNLDDSIKLEDLKFKEFEPWDSFAHLMIITEIEKTFNIMINEELIPDLNTYLKLREEIKKMLG